MGVPADGAHTPARGESCPGRCGGLTSSREMVGSTRLTASAESSGVLRRRIPLDREQCRAVDETEDFRTVQSDVRADRSDSEAGATAKLGLTYPHDPTDAKSPRSRLQRIEHAMDPERLVREADELVLIPAWKRVTDGEPRWPVSVAILAAIGLQVALPARLAIHPHALLPLLEAMLLVGLIVANPKRIDRQSSALRGASVALIVVISAANGWSAGRLVLGLVRGTEGENAAPLLLTGLSIWLTNVIAFCLWYWELDRGGPVARAVAPRPHPDFLFPQMASPELAPPHWEPGFADYLYLSFTNATAFSPTDVLPLSRWAKLTMMLQSGVSLMTVALVIARAVNILK